MKRPLPQSQEGRVLAKWVASSLREAILNGYFAPGEKIDQDIIAEELDVSRTPVREALKVLESEGFVENRSYRGSFIREISSGDVRDIYEFRWLIEAEVIRQVVPVMDKSVLKALELHVKREVDAVESGDYDSHFAHDSDFHETIINFGDNKLFKNLWNELTNRISWVRRYAYFTLHQPESELLVSLNEHIVILDKMRNNDGDGAAEAMQIHLMNSADRILQLLSENEILQPTE